MYLFSRRARLAPGNTRDAMTWATGITEKANQITGLNIGLFSSIFSPEVGSLVWSTFVPDMATLEAANDKLLVDEAYVSMLDSGAKFALGGADDTLAQIVHGEVDPNRQVEYVTAVLTVCASGNVVKGMELGVEIAQRAEKTLGAPVLFTTGSTGSYGSVGWFTGYDSVATMERALNALNEDAKFAEFIDKSVKGVYVDDPVISQQSIWRHLA